MQDKQAEHLYWKYKPEVQQFLLALLNAWWWLVFGWNM
jgi:hypothetical protein